MPADLRKILSLALKEIDDAEARDELEALKGRKVTLAEIRDAIASAPKEERQALVDALAQDLDMEESEAEKVAGAKDSESGAGSEGASGDGSAAAGTPEAPAKKTRPGRKSGRGYQWYTDDAGKVVKTDALRVYNGPDEPDEVELPAEEAAA